MKFVAGVAIFVLMALPAAQPRAGELKDAQFSLCKAYSLAYDRPRMASEESQQAAARDFENDVYLACVKGKLGAL